MPLLRILKEHHFALYQATIGLIGLVAAIHILFDYTWQVTLGYSLLTLVSYGVGQVLFTVAQRGVRRVRRGSRSLD